MKFSFSNDRNALHAAMELLLVEPDLIESEMNPNEKFEISSNVKSKPLFTRDGPFVSFQHYRQQRFQPNFSVKNISQTNCFCVDRRIFRQFDH